MVQRLDSIIELLVETDRREKQLMSLYREMYELNKKIGQEMGLT